MINPVNSSKYFADGSGSFWDKEYKKNALEAQNLVKDWIKAAIKDGWEIEPIYNNESVESAAQLSITINGDKYIVMTFTRFPDPKYPSSRYSCDVSGWKNDSSLKVPIPYSREDIIANSKLCGLCGGPITGIPIRYSFAGQACEKCKEQAEIINRNTCWD